jgi:hypothetical protein
MWPFGDEVEAHFQAIQDQRNEKHTAQSDGDEIAPMDGNEDPRIAAIKRR